MYTTLPLFWSQRRKWNIRLSTKSSWLVKYTLLQQISYSICNLSIICIAYIVRLISMQVKLLFLPPLMDVLLSIVFFFNKAGVDGWVCSWFGIIRIITLKPSHMNKVWVCFFCMKRTHMICPSVTFTWRHIVHELCSASLAVLKNIKQTVSWRFKSATYNQR